MMPASDVHDYRVLRAAQDDRYEAATGLPVTESWRQEYRDYFGVGDCAGRAVEVRWTFKRYLEGRRRGEVAELPDSAPEPEPVAEWFVTPESAFQLSGADLRVLADAGDRVAAAEIARRVERRALRRAVAA